MAALTLGLQVDFGRSRYVGILEWFRGPCCDDVAAVVDSRICRLYSSFHAFIEGPVRISSAVPQSFTQSSLWCRTLFDVASGYNISSNLVLSTPALNVMYANSGFFDPDLLSASWFQFWKFSF